MLSSQFELSTSVNISLFTFLDTANSDVGHPDGVLDRMRQPKPMLPLSPATLIEWNHSDSVVFANSSHGV